MSSLQGLILLESLLTSQSRSLSRFLSRSVSLCLSRSTLASTWDRMSSRETLLMTPPCYSSAPVRDQPSLGSNRVTSSGPPCCSQALATDLRPVPRSKRCLGLLHESCLR